MVKPTATSDAPDLRRDALIEWLRKVLRETPQLVPVSSDASFRRYFRLRTADGSSLIAMDAPPGKENAAQFLAIDQLMRAAGLHVP
ncbi:MAG: phosphotransferase, partial [Gammaproteobacteria bacterium]|nr:phosphotransferase [Gammaproteobacteria bacterium]